MVPEDPQGEKMRALEVEEVLLPSILLGVITYVSLALNKILMKTAYMWNVSALDRNLMENAKCTHEY